MSIDVNKQLKSFTGQLIFSNEPILDEDGNPTEEKHDVAILVGNIMINALITDLDDDKDSDEESTKEHRFDLSKIVYEAMDSDEEEALVTFSKSDISMIKARIERMYTTIIAGAAIDAMS